MSWYHYNCDGLDDTGWGCVYRSYQNALRLFNHPIHMQHLVHRFGKRWIEPALLRACIPSGFQTQFLLWFKMPQFIRSMRCTKPEDYDRIVPSQLNLYDEINRLCIDHVFVVDNGTHSYCIFFDHGWILLDPHVHHQTHVQRSIPDLNGWLNQSSLWMILAIAPITRKRVHFAEKVDVAPDEIGEKSTVLEYSFS